MDSLEELKAAIASIISRFNVEQVHEIENDFSVEDKISLFYLLNDDPEESLNILKERHGKYIVTNWCRDLSIENAGEWKLRLVESLALMQNFRTLQRLGYKKTNLSEVRHVLDHAQRSKEFDLRKALYSAIDNLTSKQLERLIEEVDGKSTREPTYLYQPRHIELYLLEWQISGKVDLEIASLNNFVSLLERLGFICASQCLSHALIKLHELDFKESFENEVEVLFDKEVVKVQYPDHYPLINNNNIGLCIIVNQNNYAPSTLHKPRRGSEYDCERLKKTMDLMKIKCVFLSDLVGDNIFPSIENAVRDNFKRHQHSVLFVVVMAHGDRSQICGIDGKEVDAGYIRTSLSNAVLPCLNGKPKIIIFQSCRGSSHYHTNALEADGAEVPIIKTSMKHYLICYSTIPGFKSYRDVNQGSIYINTLCDCLESFYKCQHIVDILTQVQKRFNNEKELLHHGYKISMMAEFNSSLEHHLYLYKP